MWWLFQVQMKNITKHDPKAASNDKILFPSYGSVIFCDAT